MELVQASTVNPKNTGFTYVRIWINYNKLIKMEQNTVSAAIDIIKEYNVKIFMNFGY